MSYVFLMGDSSASLCLNYSTGYLIFVPPTKGSNPRFIYSDVP